MKFIKPGDWNSSKPFVKRSSHCERELIFFFPGERASNNLNPANSLATIRQESCCFPAKGAFPGANGFKRRGLNSLGHFGASPKCRSISNGPQDQLLRLVWPKNLLIKDFSFLPKDFCLEQVVLQETCVGDGAA